MPTVEHGTSWRLFRADRGRIGLPAGVVGQSLAVVAVAHGYLQLAVRPSARRPGLRIGAQDRARILDAGQAAWFRPAQGTLMLTAVVGRGPCLRGVVCDLAALLSAEATTGRGPIARSFTSPVWPTWAIAVSTSARRGVVLPQCPPGTLVRPHEIEPGRLEFTVIDPGTTRGGVGFQVGTRGRLWLPHGLLDVVAGHDGAATVVTAVATDGAGRRTALAVSLHHRLVPLAIRLGPPDGALLCADWSTQPSIPPHLAGTTEHGEGVRQ